MTHVAMVKLDERNSKFCSVVKKKSMRVAGLVEESLIKERCKVWLPPSGETKLFIGSRNFSYLTMRVSPKT